MKLTWLGQVGLAVEAQGKLLMVDPYLLNTIGDAKGPMFGRRVPVEEAWLRARPDVILLTHDHTDHLDMPSLKELVTEEKPVEILAGRNGWDKIRGGFPGEHNYVLMKPGSEWTTGPFHIRAVEARHSDETGMGFVISAEGKTVVVSGDTLYSRKIVEEIGTGADVAYVVMNGAGNNMNFVDAARYCEAIAPKVAIPVHWGLFVRDKADPALFAAECEKRGIRARTTQIYETLDTDEIL